MKAALYINKTIFTVTTLNLSPRISTDATTLMVLANRYLHLLWWIVFTTATQSQV